MTTTTMHFGPEWMRAKQQPQTRAQAPSPPPASNLQSTNTYSALVSAAPPGQDDKQDEVHPFRYTKEELLRIYKECPKGNLGLEVERWEGVVREIGSDPVGLREMGEGEKKLFAGPLNSDLRRRQSTDYLSPLNISALGNDRSRLSLNSPSGAGSPLRERYPGLKRRDSNADSATPTLTRKLSISSLQSPGVNARTNTALPSPRVRPGFGGAGFDGVLGSEAWTSRRRISEASRPGAISRDSSGGLSGENGEKGGVGQEIRDDDQGRTNATGRGDNLSTVTDAAAGGRANANGHPSNTAGIANPTGGNASVTEPTDLAAVEWTYKDPSGNVQGPFRADIMQKWYDDGYFALELPMKRVQHDREWTTVGQLVQLAASDKIFLSPLRSNAPPGLMKRDSASLLPINQPTADSVFNNPYQPSPIRSLRSSTLDSFNGSNPSDSPSSSIGHFGNNSPDPVAFNGMVGNGGNPYGIQEGIGGLGFGGSMDLGGLRRPHLQDYPQDPRLHSPSYGTMLNHGFTNSGYSNQYNAVQSSPWGTAHDPFAAYNGNYNAGGYGAHAAFNPQVPNQVINNQINPLLYGGADLHQLNSPNHQFNVHGGPVNHVSGNDQQNLERGFGQQYQPAANPAEVKTNDQQADLGLPVSPSPKGSAPAAWDAIQPSIINTAVPTASSQSSPWGQPQLPAPAQPAVVPKDASPWVLASKGVLETPWQLPVDPEIAPTIAKLEKLVEEPQEVQEEPVAAETPALPTPAASPPVEAAPPTTKSGKKNKVAKPAPVHAPTPSPPVSASPSPSPVPTSSTPSQKAPWAKDDKKKAKAAPTISLREIQDAEAKAAEARKVKEGKERASRLAASASADVQEEVQAFTWGLPTSQTGSRSASFVKDAPTASPTPTTPNAAVWTSAAKPAVKKTMKEIQEEEERRKKTATKETVAAAAAKRAYAESTTKATPSTQANVSSGAWVTVGSSGKTGTPSTASPRPSTASIAASSTPTRPSATLRPAAQATTSKPAVSSSVGKVEDFPVTPSHEFLEWLTKSLKGLNSSVNVEEIISMLLSFSLDPDPITIEIIQETIYANSTTLDGRRFASEFVTKRKADSANRKSGAAGKIPSKPVSIAEVVKATPKANQPEWGGFKVVNKKKKNSRS